MNKLPIGKTAIDSIGFGLTNIFTTIRLGWLGLVLYLVIYCAGVMWALGSVGFDFATSFEGASGDPEEMLESMHSLMGAYSGSILASVIAAMMFVPVLVMLTRIAAGESEAPSGLAYFRFGGREIRYVLGYIIACVVYLVVFLIVFLPALIALFTGLFSGVSPEMFSDPANHEQLEHIIENNVENGEFGMAGIIAGILGFVGMILSIWFALRMSPFLATIAVENRIALFDALKMTKGNVWRIFFSLIVLIILVIALIAAVAVALFAAGAAFVFILDAAGNISEILAGIIGFVGVLFAIFLYVMLFAFAFAMEIAFPAQIYKHLHENAG